MNLSLISTKVDYYLVQAERIAGKNLRRMAIRDIGKADLVIPIWFVIGLCIAVAARAVRRRLLGSPFRAAQAGLYDIWSRMVMIWLPFCCKMLQPLNR